VWPSRRIWTFLCVSIIVRLWLEFATFSVLMWILFLGGGTV
jgi:hypothetical protein